MAKKILLFLTAAFFVLAAGAAFADDVINNPDDVGSVYTDHKAYKVGDIVTILVTESTQGAQSASLKTQKQQSLNGGMGTGTWSGGNSTTFATAPAWGAGFAENQAGGGDSVRSGSLVAKISARVEKVLSNGNLIIKGAKIIQINDDKQNLVIKGVIRPEDIQSDNTVSSTNVADAEIQYEGNGPVGEKTSPGIVTRLLDWLGIF
jgi:flagellar L-ring protein precursor FlgH